MNSSLAGHLRGQHQRLATIALALVLLLSCRPRVRAQGLINFLNSTSTLITISSNGLPVGMPGGQPGTFRFELFIAPAGTLSPASFTATGLIATNLASAGRMYGGNNRAVPGVPLGGTAAILVRGWSANLGTNYAEAIAASHTTANGYIGESSIAPNFLFGGDPGSGVTVPTSPAFGGFSGIQSGFVLNISCLSCVPPLFVVQPTNTSVVAGNTASFWATARSYQGHMVAYQWWKDGSQIAFATYSSLTLANTSLNDAGVYYVVASDIYGGRQSQTATLTVFIPAIAATLGSPAYTANSQFQFTVTGSAGSNYVVQVATNLSPPTTWISLFTNASPFTFVDSNAQNFPQRFYRASAP
jgi:hypothetical protein